LEEGNYEEAIIAFTAAIEIDPKRAEAYLGAADAYLGLEDVENAREILQKGLEQTGHNQGIIDKLEGLEGQTTDGSGNAAGGKSLAELLQAGDTGNMLQYSEVSFFGYDPLKLPVDLAVQALQENGYWTEVEEDGDSILLHNSGTVENEDGSIILYVPPLRITIRYEDDPGKARVLYYADSDSKTPETGIRGIRLNDTMEDVFFQLGFSTYSEIADAIYSCKTFGELKAMTDNCSYTSGQVTVEIRCPSHSDLLDGDAIQMGGELYIIVYMAPNEKGESDSAGISGNAVDEEMQMRVKFDFKNGVLKRVHLQ